MTQVSGVARWLERRTFPDLRLIYG